MTRINALCSACERGRYVIVQTRAVFEGSPVTILAGPCQHCGSEAQPELLNPPDTVKGYKPGERIPSYALEAVRRDIERKR